MLNDLRSAVRGIRGNPGFAATAVVTLALGIGANTAIFSVVHAVLLKALPYRDPSQLVVLHETIPGGPAFNPTSPANFRDWRAQARSFEGMAAAEAWIAVLTGNDGSEQVPSVRVSANLFDVLGARASLGRALQPGDDEPGREAVVVLGHSLWQRSFGGDRAVLGRKTLLNGEPYTVVGVMPPGFEFPTFWASGAEFWTPLPLASRMDERAGRSIRVVARLRQGVALEQARAEMSAIAAQLAAAYPEANAKSGATAQPLHELSVRGVRPMLLLLMGAVCVLLLIACVNVANLLLSRSNARRRELAVRLAIGAGRARVVRLVLVESCLLALCGGLLGLALAAWGVPLLAALVEQTKGGALARLGSVSVNGTVLAFTAAVSALAGIAFGVAPSLRSAQTDLNEALKDAARGSSSFRRGRLSRALVVAEVALSLVLLAGAGLLIRSFARLASIQPGFDARNLLTASVPYSASRLGAPGKRHELYREIVARVRAVPGVESAGAINHIPIAGDDWHMSFRVEGREYAPGEVPRAVYRVVLPGYFATMRIPFLRGRDISERDTTGSESVAVINETAARQYWNTTDAVGKRFRSGDSAGWTTVIGVVKDVAQVSLTTPPEPEYYLPHAQSDLYLNTPASFFSLSLVVRLRGDPASAVEPLRRELQNLDPGLALAQPASMEEVLARSLWQQRIAMTLLIAFSAVATLLACVGVYGVVSYAVAQRTREFAVRAAVGAAPPELLRMVLRDSASLAAAGIVLGAAGAAVLTRSMNSLLYQTGATDPLVFGASAALLAAVAALAAVVPALRAMRIDPLTALRQE